MNQARLFDIPKTPRKSRRVLMHVIDAGDGGGCDDGEFIARFKCGKCGHKTEWLRMKTTTEAKRGIPLAAM